MRFLVPIFLALAACAAPPPAPSLSTLEAAVYTFDDSIPTDTTQLEALRDTGHADYNADTGHHRKCLFPTVTHPGQTGHLRAAAAGAYRCPGHGVQMFVDTLASGTTSSVAWLLVRDELLRGQAWETADAEARRHMRILAEEAEVQGGLPRPSYEDIPDIGAVVELAPNPPGVLEAVLGVDGRVQPEPTEEVPEPEAWSGALADMVLVP